MVGTTKVASLNIPDGLVIMVVGFVPTVTPSNFIVTALLPPKLEPDIVTVMPAAPLLGDRVTTVTEVTVKVASTSLEPSVLVILWGPADAVIGMVIVQLIAPDESVFFSSTNELSKRMAVSVFGAKPDPVTVTLEPAGPLVGDKEMLATALAKSIKPVPDKPMQSRNPVNGNNFHLLKSVLKLPDVTYILSCDYGSSSVTMNRSMVLSCSAICTWFSLP